MSDNGDAKEEEAAKEVAKEEATKEPPKAEAEAAPAAASEPEKTEEPPKKKSRWAAKVTSTTSSSGSSSATPAVQPMAGLAPGIASNPAAVAAAAAAALTSSVGGGIGSMPGQLGLMPGQLGMITQQKVASQTPTQIERDSRRLFVGNLPPMLAVHELHAVFAPLGAVKAEIPVAGKSFGFVEFTHPDQASQALMVMNGFNLVGRPLRVSRPTNSRLQNQPTPSADAAVMQQLALTNPAVMQQMLAAMQSGGGLPGTPALPGGLVPPPPPPPPVAGLPGMAAPPAAPPAAGAAASAASGPLTVLRLRNMVGVEDVDEELEGEVQEECSKHGAVASVKVELQPAVAVPGVTQSVLVTVHFEAAESAAKAMAVMNGRLFAGRIVQAELAAV